MGAVRTKTFADLRHRRLQTLVIGVVLFLAAGAATLSLNILVESDQPFDHAFASANGAHLVVGYRADLGPDRLAATGHAATVTAFAGPWPVTRGTLAHPKGGRVFAGDFSGRPTPDATIDAVTIQAGRWWQAPGEVVLDQDTARLLDKGIGDSVAFYAEPNGKGKEEPAGPGAEAHPASATPGLTLTVVGIAGSVSTPDVAAWMSPTDIAALSLDRPVVQQMLYRVSPSATAADLAAALTGITSGLPASAVVDSSTWLNLKESVNSLANLYVPILLAFSIFALLAAGFTIANVVSGIVLTSYRDIGVMKAVGFTPSQVSWILLAQMLLPVVVGAVAGVAIGTLASQPILADVTMSFGLPSTFTLSWTVIGTVLAVGIGTAILAASGPAIRAGRLSAVGAITRGTAPSSRADGGRLRRLGLRLPVGLPMRLGVAAGLAHPLRASMLLGALVVGVAAITFATGLNWSLLRVIDDLDRGPASPVRAEMDNAPISGAEVTSAIAANPGTARFVSIGERQVTVSPLGAIPFVGYEDDASWLGYALIHGRWFAGAGEAVAPTNFFTQSGLHVGDSVTVTGDDGRSATVRLVGEIFDTAREGRDNLLLRGAWADLAALAPDVTPSRWEMQPNDDVDARSYSQDLREAIGPGVQLEVPGDPEPDASFLLFLSVIALMGIVLVTISVAGVFNTVLLETRQRTREMAVLKAIGMTPTQVMRMVVASIVPVALLAGFIGVPIGLLAQRLVLEYMGQVAAKTAIPGSVYDVFPAFLLLGLVLSGLAIGAAGAFLPAQRAARARIAPVLQAE